MQYSNDQVSDYRQKLQDLPGWLPGGGRASVVVATSPLRLVGVVHTQLYAIPFEYTVYDLPSASLQPIQAGCRVEAPNCLTRGHPLRTGGEYSLVCELGRR